MSLDTAPTAAFAAPAARGGVAFYADRAGVRFVCTQFAHKPPSKLGETFEVHGVTYRVAGLTDGIEGLTWRQLGQEVSLVDGLPVARYLPVVSKPSPAMVAAMSMAAE